MGQGDKSPKVLLRLFPTISLPPRFRTQSFKGIRRLATIRTMDDQSLCFCLLMEPIPKHLKNSPPLRVGERDYPSYAQTFRRHLCGCLYSFPIMRDLSVSISTSFTSLNTHHGYTPTANPPRLFLDYCTSRLINLVITLRR